MKKEDEVRQITKLRRRIEEFLRKSDVKILIKVANFLGIKVQKDLKEKYGKNFWW